MRRVPCPMCAHEVEMNPDPRGRPILTCSKGEGGCGAWVRLDKTYPYREPYSPAAPADPPSPARDPSNPKQPGPDHDDRNPFSIF